MRNWKDSLLLRADTEVHSINTRSVWGHKKCKLRSQVHKKRAQIALHQGLYLFCSIICCTYTSKKGSSISNSCNYGSFHSHNHYLALLVKMHAASSFTSLVKPSQQMHEGYSAPFLIALHVLQELTQHALSYTQASFCTLYLSRSTQHHTHTQLIHHMCSVCGISDAETNAALSGCTHAPHAHAAQEHFIFFSHILSHTEEEHVWVEISRTESDMLPHHTQLILSIAFYFHSNAALLCFLFVHVFYYDRLQTEE